MDGGLGNVEREFTALFLFAGIGAGARGFLDAHVTINGVRGRFRSVGGVDFDALACKDFEALTGSPSLCVDIGTMTGAELRAFAGERAPDVVFMSPPCQGYSGLLSETKSKTEHYQALNRLALTGVELVLDAWGSDGPGLIILENVPRIATRGKPLLKSIRGALRTRNYVTHEGSHDCGRIGRLAQSRERFLLVARHHRKVPVFLYQPEQFDLRPCGEVISTLPLPGDPSLGPMHVMPRISHRTWARLAAIRPGKDWRDLSTLDGLERPAWSRFAIDEWSSPVGAVTGSGSNSAYGVADVRVPGRGWFRGVLGVLGFGEPIGTITGRGDVTTGTFALADLRLRKIANFGCYGVNALDAPAGTITGNSAPGGSWASVADLRLGCEPWQNAGVLGVLAFSQPSYTVTASLDLWAGWSAVADPRAEGRDIAEYAATDAPTTVVRSSAPGTRRRGTARGVIVGPWWQSDSRLPSNPTINVRWCPTNLDAAPPFLPVLPGRGDGSLHRPITLRERAALQGLTTMADGSPLRLLGTLSQIAKHIGNAVPVGAALAIAGEMLRTLVLASTGAFMLSSAAGVWVKRRRDGSFPLYLDHQLRKVSKRKRRRARAHVAALPVGHNTSVCGEQPGFFGAVMQ